MFAGEERGSAVDWNLRLKERRFEIADEFVWRAKVGVVKKRLRTIAGDYKSPLLEAPIARGAIIFGDV